MNKVLETIGKLNQSYACLHGPRRVSKQAERVAQTVAHRFGLSIEPSTGDTLRFNDSDGVIYEFVQLNQGAGFTLAQPGSRPAGSHESWQGGRR